MLHSERLENPQLALNLICKTLTHDLDAIDLRTLNLKFCHSEAVHRVLKDRPQMAARIQSVKFGTPRSVAVASNKTGLDHLGWVRWLGAWLGSPVGIEVLGTGQYEEKRLVSVVARVKRA